ncbi:MAG TPA: hypothetical protein VFZ00_11115 [Solirubrobacter sp.]|nr:hypothetical protein [Solirubrobacter sp.]
MSDRCHVCGPVKHEAPTVICAPCALAGHRPVDTCARCGLVPLKPGQSSDELDVCDECERQICASPELT